MAVQATATVMGALALRIVALRSLPWILVVVLVIILGRSDHEVQRDHGPLRP